MDVRRAKDSPPWTVLALAGDMPGQPGHQVVVVVRNFTLDETGANVRVFRKDSGMTCNRGYISNQRT